MDAAPTVPDFPELGFYGLPGHGTGPAQLYDEVRCGEGLGLGSIWLSERFASKNVEVLSGAAAAVSTRLGIAAGLIANLPLRNPLVIAGYASTMTRLSAGRFALGLSRGQDALADATGTRRISLAYLEDYIDILRRLWRGESVSYDGLVGRLEHVALGAPVEPAPSIVMAVMGDRAAYLAGRICDGVLFYSWWSARAIERFTQLVRKGAADAGRDPACVRIWTIAITACDLPEEATLAYAMGRMNAILQVPRMFERVCDANGWDKQVADAARAAMRVRGLDRKDWLSDAPPSRRDRDDLEWSRDLIPDHWFDEGALIGTPACCTERLQRRFDAGADGVLLHGGHPQRLRPLLGAWRKARAGLRFEGRHCNPGR